MRIKIEGRGEYEFPDPNSLTIDETILLERTSGVGIETIIPGDAMPMGAVKAFVMIAVMRGNPNVTERELDDAIGKIRLNELQNLLVKDDEPDPLDPARTSSDGSTGSSGDAGKPPSGPSPDVAPPNGTGSPPSSLSDPPTLVA